MKLKICSTVLTLLLLPLPAWCGGVLETIDITAGAPSPIPGQIAAPLTKIFWDARCIPAPYAMNTTLDPIPNPLGGPVVSLADAEAVLQNSFDEWNALPTSYIDMEIESTTSNPGVAGFDMVNELTFRTPSGFGAIASSPSTSLIADTDFVDGMDLDGDGDSDVSATITTCQDVDGDGDIEFPEGHYLAGTILDNDIQFNAAGLRFTVNDADVDTNSASTDLQAIAVHEEGHSHGLSHVLENQLSSSDGTATTMYPFIDTSDPAAELAQRTLAEDDKAWSSFLYPEGTASSGPAALQFGDLPFNLIYGVLEGDVTHGALGEPVAGASVAATNLFTGRIEAAGFSGSTQLSYDPGTGSIYLVSPSFNIVDGHYRFPVRLGLYTLTMEATDGTPVPASSISLSAQIGSIFGQLNFNEERWNGSQEGAFERSPGQAFPVFGLPSVTGSGYDFVTNVQVEASGAAAPLTNIGFTGAAPGTYYAVRIPAADVAALDAGNGIYVNSGEFFTAVVDASVVPTFAEATLTTGSVSGGVTVDLAHPLAKTTGFIGQDTDFAPFYFGNSNRLGRKILKGIDNGSITDLFLVLRIPNSASFPGVSGIPPVIGLTGPATVLRSFLSTDGVTWTQSTNFDFDFKLVATQK